MGEITEGWDLQWLGQNVPQNWLLLSRSVTIALYGLMTLTLYQTLFQENLAKTRYAPPLKIIQWLCLPLLLAALFLPFKTFLPVMWVLVSFGLLLMTASLIGIMYMARSRVSFWYGASLGITFLSSLSEIFAAALGMKELVGIVNSVTAALASSLLVALAIAEQMRQEHRQRIEAQAELEYTYEAIPTGLFTLDIDGRFLSANPAMLAMLGCRGTAPGDHTWMQHFSEDSWRDLYRMVHAEAGGELEILGKELSDTVGAKRFLVKATLARGKIEGSLQDITEKFRATEDLRFMANNDPLTKVFNRRGIEQIFDSAINPLGKGTPLALAYLDLDRLELINDLFGHTAGDEVLRQVCQRILRACCWRTASIWTCYGGE